MDHIESFLEAFSSSDWKYWIILALAAAEASVLTSFFLSGTIGIVIVGVLISQGLLDPVLSVTAVYCGTLIGDLSTFHLSSRLQRIRHVRSAMQRFESVREPLGNAPFRFLVVGHFTPYLRAVLPVLAAGQISSYRYLVIELVAAFASTMGFIGLGYFGASFLTKTPVENLLAAVSVLAASSIVALWVFTRKPFCPLRRPNQRRWMNIRRAVFFYIWYLPWHPVRWTEIWLRGLPTRRLRRALAAEFPDVMPGDVFLIRLHAPAPWGRWAHTAMAIDSKRFVHGFSKIITDHNIACLPVRYAIAHLRPTCDQALAQHAADVAKSKIGSSVSIAAGRNQSDLFSCSSLVAFSYREVGIELVDEAVARIVPDDLFTSPEMELVRIVPTERVSRLTNRYVFDAREGVENV